jgi:hypothetical protein
MGSQEEGQSRRKDFQKKTDEDIDSFLAKRDFAKKNQPATTKEAAAPEPPAEPAQAKPAAEEKPTDLDKETEEQIKAARTSRAQLESAHEIALLRKKSHSLAHKAAKFFHKYKADEARAQKLTSKAVAHREKSGKLREKGTGFKSKGKELESELSGAAAGTSGMSPESIRDKMAVMDRRAAKQEAMAHKHDMKAAVLTEKATKFKTRAAKWLEQNKIHELEARRYAKRADVLEKADI